MDISTTTIGKVVLTGYKKILSGKITMNKTTLGAIVFASSVGLSGCSADNSITQPNNFSHSFGGEIKEESINSYHDQGLRVEEKSTKLTVNHNGKDLTFVFPPYGPDTYANVGKQIEKDGLSKPTMAETASLVHAAFNSDDERSKKIIKLMEDKYLWAFTGILYVPNKGAYIQDDPKIRNGMPYMEESDLVKKLEENDPSVRFVSFGYQIEYLTLKEIGKNKFIIGLAGEEGTQKLAEVAGKHKNNPHLWSFESVDNPLIRVSIVVSDWGLFDHRLGVDADCYGDAKSGYVFGIQKSEDK